MRIVRTLALTAALLPLLSPPAGAADALRSGNTGVLSLGSNWGPYETYQGTSFRWVDHDAEIVLHGRRGEARVAIACEGGPSLGRRAFPLFVLDTARRQVDHVDCDGPDRRAEMLLPRTGEETRYVLHAEGGGRRLPRERRILNFRVFGLDDERGAASADVVDPGSGVRLGAGWFPVEHYRGQTFRWLQNDGHVLVTADRAKRATLRLQLEVGPSTGSGSAAIVLRDRGRHDVFRTTLHGRREVQIPLQLERGQNDFTLSVSSANKPVPGDPRMLNLRVFNAAAR